MSRNEPFLTEIDEEEEEKTYTIEIDPKEEMGFKGLPQEIVD